MRAYYIFNINKYFTYIYKNNPYKLYKMLEEMYYSKDYDILITYNFYMSLANMFNKLKLNEYIINNYKEKYDYYNNDNIHIKSNNYEYSKLVIANTNLKIKSNINYPTFFNDISNYNNNIFVCDFHNKDYFWLNKISKKDRQKENYEVK